MDDNEEVPEFLDEKSAGLRRAMMDALRLYRDDASPTNRAKLRASILVCSPWHEHGRVTDAERAALLVDLREAEDVLLGRG